MKQDELSDNPTFEEINAIIEKADLKGLEAEASKAEAAGAEIALPAAVCKAYKIVRGIFKLIINLPFVPGSWKTALKVFMQFMDALCP